MRLIHFILSTRVTLSNHMEKKMLKHKLLLSVS